MTAIEASKSVPGMAEAVEQRRRELRLSLGDFAAAAGLTRQGLDPIRRGERREYQDRTTQGVADALRWKLDWYDLLVAGASPADLVDDRPTEAVDLSGLSAEDKAAIWSIIDSLKAKGRT